jgi:hypothetical protein
MWGTPLNHRPFSELSAREPLSDVGFVEWAAAVEAEVRQGCLVDLVDLLRARRRASTLLRH